MQICWRGRVKGAASLHLLPHFESYHFTSFCLFATLLFFWVYPSHFTSIFYPSFISFYFFIYLDFPPWLLGCTLSTGWGAFPIPFSEIHVPDTRKGRARIALSYRYHAMFLHIPKVLPENMLYPKAKKEVKKSCRFVNDSSSLLFLDNAIHSWHSSIS